MIIGRLQEGLYSDGLGRMRYRPRPHVALWPGLCEIFCSDPVNEGNNTEKMKLSHKNQFQVSISNTNGAMGNSPGVNKTVFSP
jgi:hypothetical protein